MATAQAGPTLQSKQMFKTLKQTLPDNISGPIFNNLTGFALLINLIGSSRVIYAQYFAGNREAVENVLGVLHLGSAFTFIYGIGNSLNFYEPFMKIFHMLGLHKNNAYKRFHKLPQILYWGSLVYQILIGNVLSKLLRNWFRELLVPAHCIYDNNCTEPFWVFLMEIRKDFCVYHLDYEEYHTYLSNFRTSSHCWDTIYLLPFIGIFLLSLIIVWFLGLKRKADKYIQIYLEKNILTLTKRNKPNQSDLEDENDSPTEIENLVEQTVKTDEVMIMDPNDSTENLAAHENEMPGNLNDQEEGKNLGNEEKSEDPLELDTKVGYEINVPDEEDLVDTIYESNKLDSSSAEESEDSDPDVEFNQGDSPGTNNKNGPEKATNPVVEEEHSIQKSESKGKSWKKKLKAKLLKKKSRKTQKQ